MVYVATGCPGTCCVNQAGLALNSEICSPVPPGAGIKGICDYAHPIPFFNE